MNRTRADKLARTLFDEVGRWFASLYDRWQDEKEYEDFQTYATVVQHSLEKRDAKFVKMTKRPFAAIFKIADFNYSIVATATTVKLFPLP